MVFNAPYLENEPVDLLFSLPFGKSWSLPYCMVNLYVGIFWARTSYYFSNFNKQFQ